MTNYTTSEPNSTINFNSIQDIIGELNRLNNIIRFKEGRLRALINFCYDNKILSTSTIGKAWGVSRAAVSQQYPVNKRKESTNE